VFGFSEKMAGEFKVLFLFNNGQFGEDQFFVKMGASPGGVVKWSSGSIPGSNPARV
jgi:hypothetical protein